MNIFICDDDNLVCEQIKTLCESYYIEHKLKRPDIYIFHSGEDILASDIKPDIGIFRYPDVWHRWHCRW